MNSSIVEKMQGLSVGGLNLLEWCGVVFFVVAVIYVAVRCVRYVLRRDQSPAASEQPQPAVSGEKERGSARETVLVIDDDPSVLKAHAKLIASLGYKVVEALSGKAAIRQVEETRPDLIVLDLLMPDQDGIETFEAIREVRPDQRAIVLSGYAGPSMVNSIQALGVHTYLVKPVERSILGKAIRDELDRAA